MRESRYTPALSDEIVVMDDDAETRYIVSDVFKNLGYHVQLANNAEEVVTLAQRCSNCSFVLDINMGGLDRQQEGLTALERIKKINNHAYVAILSSYPRKFQHMAARLGANTFREKTADINLDTLMIAKNILEYAITVNLQRINDLRTSVEETLEGPFLEDAAIEDENVRAYILMCSNRHWLRSNLGKFVAFSSGKLIDTHESQSKLLSRIRKFYPNQKVFITKISLKERVIDIPTPFLVD